MPESDSIFSEEYRTGTETAVEPKEEATVQIGESTLEFKIEEKLYGIAKPRRIVLRARIIND